ncbi:MAG TPA: dockerin type I repeat-containing protein [Planctomycetota bacterium]|jgi:hypothetical protein|nr:dockerin type I repeat-containing protein [Planctomycetota bacterium]OQC20329.1 MAG: hypothetical protein BWX69_01973 [Planctomycetes bacterium ADurb.Bin069]HNU24876.1 dockerin type I repeat-containing protein [Planctomycetota bacterium]HOE86123.1 dockerin type I repeat-containing protein [Planctomycetota bacterium]HQF65484.1 dockerin type I repeat-containing protein [Planctomycetota bacterium]
MNQKIGVLGVLLLGALAVAAQAGEVAIYTGHTAWIDKGSADRQAQICVDMLGDAGITCTWFANSSDQDAVAEWVEDKTNNGELDVLILYGFVPVTIYPPGNAQPNGSIAELFIESTDGNMILNHADYMFFVSDPNNNDAGLVNIMDIPGIGMWPNYNEQGQEVWVHMTMTPQGMAIAPSLVEIDCPRPFHIPELGGDWYVEVSLAQNGGGTRADPIIVRDGNRGRLAIVYQTPSDPNLPRGAVAAEMITYLMQRGTSSVALSGPTTTVAGTPVRYRLTLVDENGVPTPMAQAVTVHLEKDSATGAFDTERKGAFNGAVTSVTIPAGSVSAQFYYKDTAPKLVTLAATAEGLSSEDLYLEVLENVATQRGEVALYTGEVGWMDKGMADAQAQICMGKLDLLGISHRLFATPAEKADLAAWVAAKTDNGKRDVLVLYGFFPQTIYAAGNAQPDGSIAELFIESTDGDTIINHGDYMFYVTDPCCNGDAALANMMDIPGLHMWDDWRVAVTPDGKSISPSLAQYQGTERFFWTGRPFHVDLLANDWFVEAALAEDVTGTRADPIIVRDGNRGRLAPIFQYPGRPDPKGAVAAEVIAWINGIDLGDPASLGLSGVTKIIQGRPLRLDVRLEDFMGSPSVKSTDTTVSLTTNSASGRFDLARDGSYDGTVTSVTIPAGSSSAVFYYKDTALGSPTVAVSSAGLAGASLQVNIVARSFATPGEVAIYTGAVGWIEKAKADEQAAICQGILNAAGIPTTWFANAGDEAALAEWVDDMTANNRLDVLVLYGRLPNSIYPPGNTRPNGSIAESFIETTDGDAIMNHGDWMFYKSSTDAVDNASGGLQNMMDIPTITMGPDNTPMTVTAEGRAIAKHLANYDSDRPFHVDELRGNWIVEAALAEDATGTRVDPCIVRDGSRGRLITAYQTNNQDDPKGMVAAEIIAWLMQKELGRATRVGLTGAGTVAAETPLELTATLLDGKGAPVAAESAVTVTLATSSAVGAFDTSLGGAFDGSVTSVTIPAGGVSVTFYYVEPFPGVVTLTASVPDLEGGTLTVTVTEVGPSDPVFKRGDANADGKIDIADAIKVLSYLFTGGTLTCQDAADGNDDGKLDIADAVKVLGHLFAQSGPLPPPFGECGVDPTTEKDPLGCEAFAPCGWPPQP